MIGPVAKPEVQVVSGGNRGGAPLLLADGIRWSLLTLLFVLGLLGVGRYVLIPYSVNGISMQPTFRTGDVVLVWAGPQLWASVTSGQYLPARGNVVVIQKSPVLKEELIKRVIGLPGDAIAIRDGAVNITNAQYPDGFNPDVQIFGQHAMPTYGTFSTTVNSGTVFVMGDNRTPAASIDSRSSLGNVPVSNIVGRVVIRIYPLNRLALF